MLNSTRLILACNHTLLREGISKILDEDKSVQIVGVASNLLDLIQSLEECIFDILLLDVDFQGLNLTNILRLLKKNNSGKVILIIDDIYDEEELANAILAGVRGYLLKDTSSNQLKKAINAVSDGQLWVERKMMAKALDAFLYSNNHKRSTGVSSIYNLTKTEIKIVKMVINGNSNKMVARDIFLSEKTIKFHLYKIFKKLSVSSRSALILYGFGKGFIS